MGAAPWLGSTQAQAFPAGRGEAWLGNTQLPHEPRGGDSEEAGRVTRPRHLPLATRTPSPLAFSHTGVPKALVPRSAVSALAVQMVCRLAEHRPTRLACAPSSLSLSPF